MQVEAILLTYILQTFSLFSPFVISKLVTVCHLLMATNQEFFCRRQLRSMTNCSLPIKLLNCWSLSKENLPEGKSQDVTMTYKRSLHKTEHCVNNSVKMVPFLSPELARSPSLWSYTRPIDGKSMNHGLPLTLRMVRVKSDKSDWLRI